MINSLTVREPTAIRFTPLGATDAQYLDGQGLTVLITPHAPDAPESGYLVALAVDTAPPLPGKELHLDDVATVVDLLRRITESGPGVLDLWFVDDDALGTWWHVTVHHVAWNDNSTILVELVQPDDDAHTGPAEDDEDDVELVEDDDDTDELAFLRLTLKSGNTVAVNGDYVRMVSTTTPPPTHTAAQPSTR